MFDLTTAGDAATLADAAYESARAAERTSEEAYRESCRCVMAIEIGQSRADLAEGRAEVTRLLAIYGDAQAHTKACLHRRDVARERLRGLEDEQSGQGRHTARVRVETALRRMKSHAGAAHRARQDLQDSEYAMERGAEEVAAALTALAAVDDRYGTIIADIRSRLRRAPGTSDERRVRAMFAVQDTIRLP